MTLKKRRDNSRQVCSEKLDEKRVENVDTKHFNKDTAMYLKFYQAFFDHFRWDDLMANFNLLLLSSKWCKYRSKYTIAFFHKLIGTPFYEANDLVNIFAGGMSWLQRSLHSDQLSIERVALPHSRTSYYVTRKSGCFSWSFMMVMLMLLMRLLVMMMMRMHCWCIDRNIACTTSPSLWHVLDSAVYRSWRWWSRLGGDDLDLGGHHVVMMGEV